MNIKHNFIENFNYKNKNVIIRIDWNIPFNNKNYKINDNYRILSSLKTIKYVLNQDPNNVILISHLGRPKGHGFEEKYSWINFMFQIKDYFKEIILLKDGIHENSLIELNKNKNKLYLIENIRFHFEETNFNNILENNKILELFNQLGDIYINDAFSCMHRNHLSICGFNKTEKAYGYLVQNEIKHLDIINNNTDNKKILAIIGGGKIDDKIILLDKLSKKVDGIYISGGIINSIIKDNKYKNYIENIKKNKAIIYEMIDGIASENTDSIWDYYNSKDLPNNKYFFDIGILSIIELNNIIQKYDIIFWNGTLGIVENELYKSGSYLLIQLLLKNKKKVIIGGGDTSSFISKFKNNFYFVSTGGGASIEYISNGTLIGLEYFKNY